MNSRTILSKEEVKTLVNKIIFKSRGEYLTDAETMALLGSYEDKKYNDMGGNGYEPPTLQEAGAKLWQKLSQALDKKVTKTNFLQVLKHYRDNPMEYTINTRLRPEATPTPMDFPIHIERHNVESLCCKTIKQDAAMIRIRSQQRMGKTSLLRYLLDYAREQGYRTAKLDLELAIDNLTYLNSFTRWLCEEILDNLDRQPNSEEYWQAFNNVNGDLTRFLQNYLLSENESPLVLAIVSFEQLFKYSDIFSKFSSYLRAWHEKAKSGDRVGKIWRKLRVVLVYSTETYPELNINHSPFNVGTRIDLLEFNPCEVTTLAKLNELDEQLGEDGLSQLMGLVGGHPYFIQEAFAKLKSQQKMTLEELLRLAPTDEGIYSDYLRQQLCTLRDNSQLESAYKKVVMTNESVRLDTEVAFKLHSLGLVKFSGNDCIPSYDLFVQYFRVHLG